MRKPEICWDMAKKKASRRGGTPKPKTTKNEVVRMRIIGGSLGGRIVTYHGDRLTRPMKDNVRENLFNLIGPSIRSTRAIDLFAGTGALAFEAISRGASSAVAVEQNRMAAKWIRATAEDLDVSSKIEIQMGDAFAIANEILRTEEQPIPRVVFVCPPYALWKERGDDLASLIQQASQSSPPGSVIVLESDKQDPPPAGLPAIPWDERIYGRVRLQLARPADHCGLTF
ncbi:MAG: RsmD family RNA methyltransferase [Planctomycetota bacterium]